MLEGVVKLCKDILFPVFCVECGKEWEWWCWECLEKKKNQLTHWCPCCSKDIVPGKRCEACQAVTYLDGVTALFSYEEGTPVSKLIHHFKYRYVREIGDIWSKLIHIAVASHRGRDGACPVSTMRIDDAWSPVIIPVPLHPRRERERGFNQAKLLAEILSDRLKTAGYSTVIDKSSLEREKFTRQQAKLSKTERQENVQSAFTWRGQDTPPREVILVDDVFTTGATMQECACVLKQHGARMVWGFVLGRG